MIYQCRVILSCTLCDIHFVVFGENEHLLQMVLQNWLCSPYVSYIGLWPLSSALFDLTVVSLVLFSFMSCILCYFCFCVYHAVIVFAACSDAYFINISGIIIYAGREKGCGWPPRTGRLKHFDKYFQTSWLVTIWESEIIIFGFQVFVRKVIELHDKYLSYVNDCFQNHSLFHKVWFMMH